MPHRRAIRRAIRARTLLLAVALLPAVHAAAAHADPAQTVVSLTFDDASVGQLDAANIMAQYGLHGTFYVNSGRVGSDAAFLTQGQLLSIQAQGNEIAGHTTDHVDLTTLSADDAAREVCNDRVALGNMGFTVKDFAYPFGAHSAAVESIVRDCGYDSARGVASLKSLPYGCQNCPTAESIPPADPYAIRTNSSVKSDTTLAILETYVTQAEQAGGGWVPLLFHHVSPTNANNDVNWTSTDEFTQFVQWLSQRPATTSVRTVDQVIGGPLNPPVPGPPLPTQQGNLVQNYSLETWGTATSPATCFQFGASGTNTRTWTRSPDARSGYDAQQLDITAYTSGDAKLVTKQDAGACAPAVSAGQRYQVGVWYKGNSTPASFVVYYRDAGGAWRYWATSPAFPAQPSWAHATWTTPLVPAGATALSFGLAITAVGSLTTDDYQLGPA